MIFHRLRVISFSKSLISTKGSNRKKTDVIVHNKDLHKEIEALTQKEAHSKKDMKENKTVYIKNSSRSVDPSPVKPRSQYKSESETFRIPSKTLNNQTIKKTISLNDLKMQFSIIDFVGFNHIRHMFQTYRKEKAIKKSKKQDVKVLYVAESRPRIKRRSNRKQDILQSSDNLFGFYRTRRPIDSHMFSQSYNKSNNPFHKLKTKSFRKRKKLRDESTEYSHHSLKVISSGKIRVSQSYMSGYCNDTHYNILRFPHTTTFEARQKNSSLKLYRSKAQTNDRNLSIDKKKKLMVLKGQTASTPKLKSPAVCVDKAVSTCKSLKLLKSPDFKAPVDCVDETVSTCKSVRLLKSSKSIKVQTAYLKSSKERRKCNRSTRKFRIKRIYSKIFHKLLTGTVSAHYKPRLATRTIAKHILISLVVLAWSPCILSMGICWIISYPLRLQHVINYYNIKKYKRREDCHATHQYDWWLAITSYTRRLTKEIKKALSSLLLKEQSKLGDLPHHPHPDPRKRYTLFHAQDRGWVIKPVRVCERLHPNQCRFMQIFQNLFCDCYHRTSTTSAGQRTSRVIRRTSSHATCKNAYDRKSRLGKQLDYKHVDCQCLDPSNTTATQKPRLTCKPCAQTDDTICKTGKKKTCKKLNTKLEDTLSTTRAKLLVTPQNKEGISKTCLPRDDFYVSGKPCQTETGIKNVVEKLAQIPKSSERPHKKVCECQNEAKKLLYANKKRLKSMNTTQSKSSTQLTILQSAGKTCRFCTIATNKSVSEKLFDTKRDDKCLNKNKKIKIDHCSCNKAAISGPLETKRSRSATRLRRRDLELVLPIPARSRSVSKKNASLIYRSSKPDRIAIVASGPVTCSGEPRKVITRAAKQNMHSGLKKSAAKSTKVRATPKATTGSCGPPKNKCRTVLVQCSSKNEKKKNIQKEKGSKIKKLPFGQRFMAWVRGLYRSTAKSVNSYDKDLQKSFFPAGVKCGDLYIYTLRSRPWFWIYKASPSCYPWFLRFYYCSKTCCSHCLFSISLCLCAPIAVCCYGFFKLCSCSCGC